MTTRRSYLASPIGTETVPPLTLVFDQPLPDDITGPDWERRRLELYTTEGKALADALREHLPGGLFDALMVAMLEHKRSLFRVRWGE